MKIKALSLAALLIGLVSITSFGQETSISANKGLPYTKSAREKALNAINGTTAIFAGGRYAYVNNFKVRLDTKDILKAEAILKDGKIYVPATFASVIIDKKPFSPKPIPKGLESIADKWVYDIERNNTQLPINIANINIKGAIYIDAAALALSVKKQIFQTKRGLLLISDKKINYPEQDKVIDDCVVTLFDTPEKFADPDIATQYIPILKQQGKWTNHVKVTPEQHQILDGPETEWEFTPASKYDYTGFNFKLLGSKVPAPGIYPRILFSEGDLPMLMERIKSSKMGQMSLIDIEHLLKSSWWDVNTSDGKVFKKLYTGDLIGLEWANSPVGTNPANIPQLFKGQTPGIHNSHVAYIPECLTQMALYCLLTNDNIHGKQAAAAIANYFKLREPLIDEWNAVSDIEMSSSYTRPDGTIANVSGNGASSTWRNIHAVVAHMNLGLSLDFAGKWMSQDEKDIMRRVIVKATYGRRGYSQDGPIRFRDINWSTWDLSNFLAVTAIEGLEGFDKEVYQANCETVKAFCEWGIDDNGIVYESNGKSPGGLQFHTLSMIALARRGENLWGHPHIRKLLSGQVLMTSPDGKVIVNSGTQYVPFSQSYLSYQTISEYKSFYPNDLSADYLLSQPTIFGDRNDEVIRQWVFDNFNPDKYKEEVKNIKRLRMPSPSYPGFVHSFLYDTDFKITPRSALNLPLELNAPTHGVHSSYSSDDNDAAWMNMMVRPDHYLGGGHHHSDAGMFHFSALGVNWFTESPFPQAYDGNYHNLVLVDGLSEPSPVSNLGTGYQAAAKYLSNISNNNGGFATADLTNSYSYRWQTQPGQVWEDKITSLNWELDPSTQNLKMFAGTSRYKMRPWWATYTYSNYIATSRALFNPMNYVYRTTGLVRGNHSYGVIIDDLKKDENQHLYQWTAMLNGGVWQADIKNLPVNQMVLAQRPYDNKIQTAKSLINPQKGESLLMVCILNNQLIKKDSLPIIQVVTDKGPLDPKQAKTQFYDKISIDTKAVVANYKILLIPFKYGEDLPTVKFVNNIATIIWKDGQTDRLSFNKNSQNRNIVSIMRNGKTIIDTL